LFSFFFRNNSLWINWPGNELEMQIQIPNKQMISGSRKIKEIKEKTNK
jgi:hypothetical protein